MADFLLLHGMAVDSGEWERVIPLLQANPRTGKVVAPNFPGRDANRPGEFGSIRLSDYLATALAALRDNDLQDTIVVGHSGGGTTMQALAAAEPERIRRLVFLCAAVPRRGKSLLDLQPLLVRLFMRAMLWIFRARQRGILPNRRLARRGFCSDLQPQDCEMALSNLVPEPQALLTDQITWDAARMQAPATYILTTQDRVIRPKDQRRMAGFLPHAEILSFPNGHASPVMYPERLVELLLSYA